MKTIAVLFLASHLFVPIASAAAQSPAAAEAAPAFHVGDAVRITVWRNPDLSGQFDVTEDGTIIHPVYRSVRVAGVPVPQVQAQLRTVLQRFETNPEFVVEPLFRVAIGGEVRTPNIYTLPPYTSVAQAVVQAGGPTPDARVKRVRLLRDGQTIFVDLTRPHSELANLRIRSGDQIVLDEQRNLWSDTIRPALTTASSVASIAVLIIRLGS